MEHKVAHTRILKNIARFIDLTALEQQKYLSLLTAFNVKKKEFLLQAGDLAKYEYFVTKGCLKVYTLDEEGTPHISMFAVEDFWTGDIASFMTKEPTRYFIRATEESELLGISRAIMTCCSKKYPSLRVFIVNCTKGR